MIAIVGRLKRDGLEFAHIQFSLAVQDVFVNAHVYDLADDVAVLVYLQEFALQRYRQLINEGSVHTF